MSEICFAGNLNTEFLLLFFFQKKKNRFEFRLPSAIALNSGQKNAGVGLKNGDKVNGNIEQEIRLETDRSNGADYVGPFVFFFLSLNRIWERNMNVIDMGSFLI